MRTLRWMMLNLVVIASGCSTGEPGRKACSTQQAAEPAMAEVAAFPSAPRSAPGLIFDRQPGQYSADQFAVRSDWPSTLGYFRTPEVIFYRELFRDRQGPGSRFDNATYRRFDMSRHGQAIR